MKGTDADVIVVGAGAAGLAAARRMAARSARVLLIEARDRIGGRVLLGSGPRPGTFAELGAEFVHGKAETTRALLHEAGLAATEVDGQSWSESAPGEVALVDADFTAVRSVFDRARLLAADESVDRFLASLQGDEATRSSARLARAFVEGFDAADPLVASARAIADEWRSDADSGIARPAGGYRPMFEYLVRACVSAGVKMRLSTTVRQISWEHGAAAIAVDDEKGGGETLSARCAIVTLPIGVLRDNGDRASVAFVPELPPAKREALRSLEMGHAMKVALWFRTAFWERLRNGRYRDAAFFRVENQPFATYWTQFPERSTQIVAWAGGPKAVALAGMSETDLVRNALNGLGALSGLSKVVEAEFEAAAVHDWSRDPFSGGAYSYVAIGGEGARATLAEPVHDTLFFAGEATSVNGYGGTVNGALESGERAAAEAAASLRLRAR